VLEALNPEFTTERYYEESAKQVMQYTLKTAAAQSSHGGSMVWQKATKSDIPTNSQLTGTNISQNRTKSLKKH